MNKAHRTLPSHGALRLWTFVLLCLLSGLSTAQTVTYFHNDAAGTPVLATDAAGQVVWRENYRPYGERLNDPQAAANNAIGFAGRPFDAATGLSYMGARYYDPVVGRFMGTDVVGFREENLQSFNRYAYANNNPYKYVDPDGKYAELAVEALSLALGIGSARKNFRAGNYAAAAVDAAGVAGDAVLAVVPGAPGFIGIGIKASREATEAAAKGVAALQDGAQLPTGKALDAAVEHLGPGYKEIASGVFRSADGKRMVRMTESDLAKTGNHAGAPHMNFESGRTVMKPNGKEQFISQENKHIFLPQEK